MKSRLKTLNMEEGHMDWAEIQHAQIAHMGMENYLDYQAESTAIKSITPKT